MVKPIEVVSREDLITREKFWIAELQTLFPYGLNMEANFKGIQDAYAMVISNTSDKKTYMEYLTTKQANGHPKVEGRGTL